MAGSWQPQEDGLRHVLKLLKETQTTDTDNHCAVKQKSMEELNKYPDVNNYLIYVLSKLTSEDEEICSQSGSILKSNVEHHFHTFPQAVADFIRSECLSTLGLAESSPRIRATIGSLVATIARGRLANWPDLLPKLCQMLDSKDSVHEDALGVLHNICEDSMGDLLQCMLDQNPDNTDTVALEAYEFWRSLINRTNCKQVIHRHIPRLVPILVKGMQLSKIDVEEEETSIRIPDTVEDESDSSDEMDLDDASPDRDLRKYSKDLLEELAKLFKDDLLPGFLPTLKETLSSPNWKSREAGLLALGTISEDCKSGMTDHMANLFPLLIKSLSEEQAAVRVTAFWTLSCYADWLVNQPHDQYLKPLMSELLKRIETDGDELVQASAFSTLEALQEEAGTEIVPYLGVILKTLVDAYGQYQRQSLLCLYDTIGNLACSVGSQLNQPDYITLLMPPLVAKFNMLMDDDKDLLPFMECLSSVATALQSGFLPYLEPVYYRCISIVGNAQQQEQQLDQLEAPDENFTVAALELLKGLTEGLGLHVEQYIVASNVMQLLLQSMQNPVPEVRQSSFALLGEFAKTCFNHVLPCLPDFLPILGQNLDPESAFVCANATWAIGEISLKLGYGMINYIPLFLTQLVSTINRPDTPEILLENTAVTLGRLGYVCPVEVAKHFKEFSEKWFVSMRSAQCDEEKISAFRGMCNVILDVDPSLIVPDFDYFCEAAVSWANPPSDLKDQFAEILGLFTGAEVWEKFYAELQPLVREKMMLQYGI